MDPFELIVENFPERIQDLSRQVRALIHKVYPEVVEVPWVQQKNIGFGTGPKKKTEHFCWLMPATHHVTLGFNYGAALPDPNHLLEGSGKFFRHVKIKSTEQLKDKALLDLLQFSIHFRGAE